MKIADYRKYRQTRSAGLVLMDLEPGEFNNKEYTIGFTEDGRRFCFVADNYDAAVEAGVVVENGDANTATVDTSKLVNFDSGLSYIQLEEQEAWSADKVAVRGKK